MTDPTPVDAAEAKRAMRRMMRKRRREMASPERSTAICTALTGLVDPTTTQLVMVFDAVPGEPDLTEFVAWCAEQRVATVAPEASSDAVAPVQPREPDVIVVPGVAFTVAGHRLGQGGGWYDRFLAGRRPDCLAVGVAFNGQVVDDVPSTTHDVDVDVVVTDRGMFRSGS